MKDILCTKVINNSGQTSVAEDHLGEDFRGWGRGLGVDTGLRPQGKHEVIEKKGPKPTIQFANLVSKYWFHGDALRGGGGSGSELF